MEVDDEAYRLEDLTTYDIYLDLKPAEKPVLKEKKMDGIPDEKAVTYADNKEKNK